MLGPIVRQKLLKCWRDVSNAGDAVGFLLLPLSDEQVQLSVEAMVQSLDERANRLLLAAVNDQLAGWLFLAGNSNVLTEHWALVLRIQTALGFRKRGAGRALMSEVARAAAEDFSLEQLHLELRAVAGMLSARCIERESVREV